MSKKVCIFDIDNTLTHGADATPKICCPSGEKNCLVSKYQPQWPPKKSGTSQYALDTIKKCKDHGYEIAIATAETGLQVNPPKQRKFVREMIGKNLYDTPMLQNSCTAQGFNYEMCTGNPKTDHVCCNTEYTDKTRMYLNIMNHLDIDPVDYGNSIVFDDDQSNLETARGLGFKTCQASLNCGGSYCTQGCGIPMGCSQLVTSTDEDDLVGVV